MKRRTFLKSTSAAALTAVASTGTAAASTEDPDGGVGTYSNCEECWNNGGSYSDCCGPYGPCTDCEMK